MNIYVGMSGGVDSSLTAALLKEQGHQVTGVYMKNWAQEWSIFDCPWAQDLEDASAVASQLGIPFKVFDFRDVYRHKVVDYLLAEYQVGRTPNPDIMCNQEVKFGLFLQTALAEGAQAVATGHYARVKDGQLLAGVDRTKDQSYFLYRIKPEALPNIIMPIGELTKPQVRQMAKDRGLATAAKKDSQGICFIGKVDLKKFLQQYVDAQPGEVRTLEGHVLGRHQGAMFYTIGQRQGLGIGGGKPYFVVSKDMEQNIVYVTTSDQAEPLWSNRIILDQLHWLGDQPDLTQNYQVQVRYRAPRIDAKLELTQDGRLIIHLSQPQRAIACGQSTVIYDGERVLGGGLVVSASQTAHLPKQRQVPVSVG